MASTANRKADTGFLIILSSVYLAAALVSAVAVGNQVLSNGMEFWSAALLAGALLATGLWASSVYRFSTPAKRLRNAA